MQSVLQTDWADLDDKMVAAVSELQEAHAAAERATAAASGLESDLSRLRAGMCAAGLDPEMYILPASAAPALPRTQRFAEELEADMQSAGVKSIWQPDAKPPSPPSPQTQAQLQAQPWQNAQAAVEPSYTDRTEAAYEAASKLFEEAPTVPQGGVTSSKSSPGDLQSPGSETPRSRGERTRRFSALVKFGARRTSAAAAPDDASVGGGSPTGSVTSVQAPSLGRWGSGRKGKSTGGGMSGSSSPEGKKKGRFATLVHAVSLTSQLSKGAAEKKSKTEKAKADKCATLMSLELLQAISHASCALDGQRVSSTAPLRVPVDHFALIILLRSTSSTEITCTMVVLVWVMISKAPNAAGRPSLSARRCPRRCVGHLAASLQRCPPCRRRTSKPVLKRLVVQGLLCSRCAPGTVLCLQPFSVTFLCPRPSMSKPSISHVYIVHAASPLKVLPVT